MELEDLGVPAAAIKLVPPSACSPDDVLGLADACLYRVKETGRKG